MGESQSFKIGSEHKVIKIQGPGLLKAWFITEVIPMKGTNSLWYFNNRIPYKYLHSCTSSPHFSQQWTTDMMVVPQDYNGAEKFLPPRDIVDVTAQHIPYVFVVMPV